MGWTAGVGAGVLTKRAGGVGGATQRPLWAVVHLD